MIFNFIYIFYHPVTTCFCFVDLQIYMHTYLLYNKGFIGIENIFFSAGGVIFYPDPKKKLQKTHTQSVLSPV